jgi:hypothetical protein
MSSNGGAGGSGDGTEVGSAVDQVDRPTHGYADARVVAGFAISELVTPW